MIMEGDHVVKIENDGKGTAHVPTISSVFMDNVNWMRVQRPLLTTERAVVVKIADTYLPKTGSDARGKLA